MEAVRYKKSDMTSEDIQYINKRRRLLVDWFSGLAGGFVSVTCCAPLDVARTRHMVLVILNPNISKSLGNNG